MFIQIAENMFHSDAKKSNTKKQTIPTLDIYTLDFQVQLINKKKVRS